jgi:hypothetical protein
MKNYHASKDKKIKKKKQKKEARIKIDDNYRRRHSRLQRRRILPLESEYRQAA